jgi:hypothetical protein
MKRSIAAIAAFCLLASAQACSGISRCRVVYPPLQEEERFQAASRPSCKDANTLKPGSPRSELGAMADPEGGSSEESEDVGIVLDSFYFLDGDPSSHCFRFFADGGFRFDSPEVGSIGGVYSVKNDRLKLRRDEYRVSIELAIEDGGALLVDSEGARYVLVL